MLFKDLCKFVDANREVLNPNVPIGVRDHYGDLEDTLESLELVVHHKRSYIALVGVTSQYPEPH